MAFLSFRNKRVAASAAAGDSTVPENVILGSVYALTRKYRLSRFEHVCRDEWLVISVKGLPSLVDSYQGDIEGILENCSQAVHGDWASTVVPQATSEHLLRQIGQ